MFQGSFTALITPFKGGQIDDKAFERLVEWQIEEGTHGLVPVGTTGESPTLTVEEHIRVIEITVQHAKKRVPVIAGTGSNSTRETIDMSAAAKKVGADGLLLVTPLFILILPRSLADLPWQQQLLSLGLRVAFLAALALSLGRLARTGERALVQNALAGSLVQRPRGGAERLLELGGVLRGERLAGLLHRRLHLRPDGLVPGAALQRLPVPLLS